MSDIKFRLGLNSSEFDRGLGAAETRGRAFGAAMEDVGGKLQRTFGAGDVFKGLLQGLGIGSAEKIAEKISEGFRKAAESAKELAESTARALGLYERMFKNRRTDSQNLDANKREQEKLLRELGELKDPTGKTTTKLGANFQVYTVTEGASEAELQEVQEKRAKIAERLAELSAEEQDLKKKIAEGEAKRETEAKKASEDRVKKLEELDELQRDNARANMTAEQQIADLQAEQNRLIEAAASGEGDWVAQLTKAARLQREIRSLEQKRAEEQKRRAEQEKRLNKQLEQAKARERDAKKDLSGARGEQFSFTLGEAADGTRGSPEARSKARLFNQKTKQLNAIVDQGGYQVAFDEQGTPTLKGKDGRAAKQATERFRKLYGDREALRGSIAGLSAADKDPLAQNVKAVETATKEVKGVLEEIRDAKFTNQP